MEGGKSEGKGHAIRGRRQGESGGGGEGCGRRGGGGR